MLEKNDSSFNLVYLSFYIYIYIYIYDWCIIVRSVIGSLSRRLLSAIRYYRRDLHLPLPSQTINEKNDVSTR
jgi:hypothetical protein